MPLQLPSDLMVGVSGFRGRVGESFTPELVTRIAASFGGFLRRAGGSRPVYVGRDSRTSGPQFERAVVAGLLSVGVDVIELGIVPTPTFMLAIEEGDGAGGICVTASHNPAEWNALKFASSEGMFLDSDRMDTFLASLEEEPAWANWDTVGSVTQDDGAVQRHLDRILELDFLDVDRIRSRGLRVALDCVHGAGGTIMPALLDALGCEVSAIGLEMDGRFPREPEPTAENLRDLADLVLESGADIGLAVDPDVDRLSLVDEEGRPLGEDLTLALAAAVVLGRGSGTVVTNLSTSRVVDDVAEALGGQVLRAPVGEINVAKRMQDEGAVIGGEGNGGVILPALHLTRDAPVGTALLLQHLTDEGASLSEIVSRWPVYSIVKTKLSFPRESLEGAYAALEGDLGSDEAPNRVDGLRLVWNDPCWLHVRPSGTEPVVRVIAEARDEKAARGLVERAKDVLSGVA
jgi:phosphomannomutase